MIARITRPKTARQNQIYVCYISERVSCGHSARLDVLVRMIAGCGTPFDGTRAFFTLLRLTQPKRITEIDRFPTREAIEIHAPGEADGVFLRELIPSDGVVRLYRAMSV